jgi:hypothetical protein
MKNANSQSGVRMAVMSPAACMVGVDVPMGIAVMSMFMNVQLKLERLTQTPNTDADEHDADQAFTLVRKPFNGKQFAKQPRQYRHKDDTTRVPQSPAHPQKPRIFSLVDGEGSHGRQVIRACNDVNGPGCEAREQNRK